MLALLLIPVVAVTYVAWYLHPRGSFLITPADLYQALKNQKGVSNG